MASYDGVEVCKLVGLFILHQLSQLVGVKNIGLYKYDGLAILENASGPTSECIKKKIIKLFHQHSLTLSIRLLHNKVINLALIYYLPSLVNCFLILGKSPKLVGLVTVNNIRDPILGCKSTSFQLNQRLTG